MLSLPLIVQFYLTPAIHISREISVYDSDADVSGFLQEWVNILDLILVNKLHV